MTDVYRILSGIVVCILFIYLLANIWANSQGAPYLPTRRKKVKRMLELAQVKPGETVYDLGCGDGRVLIMAAKKFGAMGVGIEIHPLRYIWCQIKITFMGLRRKVKIKYGDLLDQDISSADIVFCYLLPSTNVKLEWKFIKELSSKTRIVSNTFIFHTLQLLQMDTEFQIYLYRIGLGS